jgi:hypothetical protein
MSDKKSYGNEKDVKSKNVPIDKTLYETIKKTASKKFKSPSGIYRSSWIVKEYKRQGGKYYGKKNKSVGLLRWFKEKWVDINRPVKNLNGQTVSYKICGRKKATLKGVYPLCRPSKRINKNTPKTYKEISKKSMDKAKKDKKSSVSIKFAY